MASEVRLDKADNANVSDPEDDDIEVQNAAGEDVPSETTKLTSDALCDIGGEGSLIEPEPDDSIVQRKWSRSQYMNNTTKQQVDYVLVFEVGDGSAETKRSTKRQVFERNLKAQGLILEHDGVETSHDGKTCFVKIHAPWDVLTQMAEIMRIKMPIKTTETEPKGILQKYMERLERLLDPFRLPSYLNVEQAVVYTAPFSRELEDKFLITDKETFFTPAQRSRIVWDILSWQPYDEKRADRIGIRRLLQNDSYTSAYPLHEGDYESVQLDGLTVPEIRNDRQLLYESWVRPKRWYKHQPINLIRKYFGAKIGFYFAWLGFYTKVLLVPAIIGVICVIYGVSTFQDNVPSAEICDINVMGNTTMCPWCSFCSFWKLNETCGYSKFSYVFDNSSTVVFAVIMSVWATLFLEFWKRQQAIYQWNWDLMDFEIEEEQLRPEYQSLITKRKLARINPITKEQEPFVSFIEKAIRVCASGLSVLFFLCLVITFVFSVILYRIMVSPHMHNIYRSYATMLIAISAALLNLICIMILGRVYQWLAWYLTELEFPRTHSEFESSYTFKVFLFQFINYYSSLFYVAFIKGRFAVVPKKEFWLFGKYRPEQCDPSGCFAELLIQLAIIMVGKQLMNNFMELIFPLLQNWWRELMSKRKADTSSWSRWEKDYSLNALPAMPLFDEYLEMVIQYGFVTLFVAAFPLAPLFALLNNILEIRLDAYKFVTAFRRPLAERSKDIGAWYHILDGISNFAVVTNACVIAFTTDFVPHMVYRYLEPEVSRRVGNHSLNGFMKYSLSKYYVKDLPEHASGSAYENETFCYYADYRRDPCDPSVVGCDLSRDYTFSSRWWNIFAAKLAFVIVFEHVVFLVKAFFAYLIPDMPHSVVQRVQREHLLAKQAKIEYELSRKSQRRLNALNPGGLRPLRMYRPSLGTSDQPEADGLRKRSDSPTSPKNASSLVAYLREVPGIVPYGLNHSGQENGSEFRYSPNYTDETKSTSPDSKANDAMEMKSLQQTKF